MRYLNNQIRNSSSLLEGMNIIKKIISIKSVALFSNNSYAAELKKFNIIYGENGRGKSTFANILRSLSDGEPTYILERKTVNSVTPPEVRLLIEPSKHIAFNNGNWNEILPDLEIFDNYFISNYVYSGNDIGMDHRRNLHQFVIGQDGARNADTVNRCDQILRSLNSLISTKEKEIKQCLQGKNLNVATFVSMSDDPTLSPAIDKEIDEKKKIIDSLKMSGKILESQSLHYLSIPKIPREQLEEILAKGLSGISKDAEAVTHEHVKKNLDKYGESWIQAGFCYIKESMCPFCGESILDNILVNAYKSYFDMSYISFKKDIYDFSTRINNELAEHNLLAIRETYSSNNQRCNFWKDYIQIGLKELDILNIENVWTKTSLLIDTYLKRKGLNPLESIELKSDLLVSLRNYNFIYLNIIQYNAAVKEINTKIDEMKKSIKGTDLEEKINELELLENKKIRLNLEIKKLCDYYKRLLRSKDIIISRKAEAKAFLDSYTSAVFTDYEIDINSHLENCGAGFKIEEVKTTYVGGKASIIYNLSIMGTKVDLSTKSGKSAPCFKNTLSEGDKNTLAFIFFLAKLERDPNISQKIVVFDDPVSSLDSYRRSFTQQQILRLSQSCKQVIILTHDLYLARQIFSNARVEICTLQVKRKGDTSVIERWDIEKDIQSDYFQNFDTIDNYIERGPENSAHQIQAVRCIRPLLEGYLRIRFPKEFGKNEWLGNFLDKMRQATPSEPLYSMHLKYDELEDINNYSKKYHHDQNPGADSEPINDTELKSYAQRAINFIQN